MEEIPGTSKQSAPVRAVKSGQPFHSELQVSSKRVKKRKKKVKELQNEDNLKLQLCSLFRYASPIDIFILLVGLTFAIIHGAMFPVLALVFGQMTNIFIDQAKESGAVSYSGSISELSVLNLSSYDRNLSNISEIDVNNRLNSPSRQEEFIEYLADYAYNYLYIGLAVLFASFIQTVCWEISCERQVFQLRRVALTQLLRQDISWYDTRQNTNLTNILSDDVERVREGIGCKFSMVTQYLSTFICGTLVGFAVNWKLTAALMVIAPFLIVASAYLAKLTASSAAREQLKYGEAGAVAAESLTSISTVAAFGKETQEINRYDQALEKGRVMAMRKYSILAWGLTLVFFLMYGQYAVAFYYGAQLIDEGYCSPGSVFTVFFSVLSGAFTLGNALPYVNSVATAFGSASSIFRIIDRTPPIDAYSKAGLKIPVTKGHIQFKNVSFSYASRPDVQVIQGLNLDIQPGKTVAFVGPSGCGKSTIVRLFLRFYNVDGGQILLDGSPLEDLNLSWLRAQVGVVWQEPVLFEGSIADNIRHGREGVTQDEIEMAATMANVHAFIDGLPQGYETLVGDNGAQLSGGQKQRIAIARALVRDPAILLLDEATSALDLHSESVVQEALERAMLGRTTIIIAHRLSTVRHADLIYTLKRGKVVEQGNHPQLMHMKGFYHQLVETQAIFNQDEGYLTDYINHSLIPVNYLMSPSNWKSVAYAFQPLESGSESGITQPLRPRHPLMPSLISLYQPEEDPFPEGEPRKVNMGTLVKMHRPECGWLLLGILGSSISGAIMPLFAFFYGEVFASFTKTGEELQRAAIFWSCMFLLLGVLAAISIWLEVVTMTEAVERLVMRLRSSAFRNILCQPVGWFDLPEHSSGRLTSRLARDAPLIKGAAGLRLGQLMSAGVTLTAALSVAFVFGWKLAFVLLLVVPLVTAGAYHQTAMVRQTQNRDTRLMDNAGRTASESVRNISTVQAFGLESYFVNSYMECLRKPYREAKRQAICYSVIFAMSQAVIYVMYAGAFRFGAYLIEIGDMTSTEVYRVFFALAFCAASVGTSSAYVQDYNKAKIAARQMFALIERKSEIDTISPYGLKPRVKGLLRFDSVYFYYPTRPDVQVFRGLTLTVAPGQTLAVIGQSGCGKSTILALLQRFYPPTRGSVMVDETDIQDINVHHLRQQIGLVTQEPVLFNRTIRENIAYGLADELPSAEVTGKVIQAAVLANCHSFITQMPQGYETMVGRGGSQLSGGQKQRIAIARALVRDPRILLLDEATSALDTKSEELVQAALDNARGGRTCIIIAHRLSTIQSADLIAVLDQGKIREIGSHDELRRKKGLYYKLIRAHSL